MNNNNKYIQDKIAVIACVIANKENKRPLEVAKYCSPDAIGNTEHFIKVSVWAFHNTDKARTELDKLIKLTKGNK